MSGTPPRPPATSFDVCGPLPDGTTVLEASAGTGKTATIAALATRYVAEGHATLDQLMIVTFGRAATSELRDRVRERLLRTARALARETAATDPDPLVRHLARDPVTGADARRPHRDRLTRALAGFDAATIATTHGFSHQMLAALGVAADLDRDAVLQPDQDDLVEEIVDDVYLRLHGREPVPAMDPGEARTLARAAVRDPDARLEPHDADPGTPAHTRYRFAATVRRELVRRRRLAGTLDYDDLLLLLRDALLDPVTGPDAARRVRERYRVVLVDEFQDTDRVQWQILRAAFHGHRPLILIGDPKQAVYAFRGADVVTYLEAAGEATAHATLDRTWRSDPGLLRGLGHLLTGVRLGDPRIVVRPVEAARDRDRLHGRPALRLRQITRTALPPSARGSRTRPPQVAAVRQVVHADVAAQVVDALGAVTLDEPDGPDGGTRPLRPGDVAVLTRRNQDAAAVRDALAAAGVPAVVSGQASVFGTPAARAWFVLLTALTDPADPPKVAAAALTPFLGWDARRLAEAPEPERDSLAGLVRGWSGLLETRGVAALVEAASAAGLAERVLAVEGGERTLTDLRHVAEGLHAVATDDARGPAALTEWLRTRIAEAERDLADERSRRLETDADAVQVVTVHASKGLEFPVVFVPFGWDRFTPPDPTELHCHDADGARILHVGGPDDLRYGELRARHDAEALGEDLRLAYVALTRASSQVVVWWAPATTSASGALTRLLLAETGPSAGGDRSAGGDPAPPGIRPDPPLRVRVPPDAAVTETFARISSASGGSIVHEVVHAPPPTVTWSAPAPAARPLDVARFDRALDLGWRRLSYSALTATAHEAHLAPGTDPMNGESAGRPASSRFPVAGVGGAELSVPAGMRDLPGGAAFGTLTHEVLEHVDTSAPDLAAELRRRCAATGLAHGLGVEPERLAEALLPVLETPLGPNPDDGRLRDVAPADRLSELAFELPLAGGDRERRDGARLRDVARLLRRHLRPDDPFAPYADRLESRLMPTERLRGYLTGSIDAVLRRTGPDGVPRFTVVDYKTNLLAGPGEELTARHYRPAAMVREMLDAHYPLQLLLYAVALHRYLAVRLPGYDPEVHVGEALYLFVRGMTGPATPVVDGVRCGVMAWRPPAGLVIDLSRLLDGTRPVAGPGATP